MIIISKRLFLLSIIIFLAFSCAHQYTGPMPNFKVSENDMQQEYDKFHIKENGYWLHDANGFEMGQNEKRYTYTSMRPVFEKVSPIAIEKFNTYEKLRTYAYVPQVAMLALLAAKLSSDSNKYDGYLVASALAVGGLSLTALGYSRQGVKQYNKDLKQKFAPSIAYSFNY